MPKDTDEEQAFQLTTAQFKDLIGKIYVEKYFNPDTKKEITGMVKDVLAAYKKEIGNAWLNAKTKENAYKKIDNMVIKVGYPDKWENYSSIIVKPYSQGGNIVQTINSITAEEVKKNIAKFNEATDRTEWVLTPQIANAYYNASNNEIVFTAAILQAPLYSANATEAQNLGAVGAVIGHEISHAFDSSGAQFDYKGNLNNWWTKADYKAFQKRVQKAAKTFSKYEVVPGYYVNGEISTGEILADLGGLTIVTEIAKEKHLDLKEVYESYARVWAGIGTKENAIDNITDEHPYNKYRVNSIVNMLPEFYEVFNVKKTDKMYVAPKDRLTLWT